MPGIQKRFTNFSLTSYKLLTIFLQAYHNFLSSLSCTSYEILMTQCLQIDRLVILTVNKT
jgi:hypothetical protein